MGSVLKRLHVFSMKVFCVCAFLAFSAVAVSGYSSGYGSGSASSYASAATPPPAPGVENFVVAAVKLAGISKAQFGATEQASFKTVVAAGVKFCGSNGASQCVAKDVVIT